MSQATVLGLSQHGYGHTGRWTRSVQWTGAAPRARGRASRSQRRDSGWCPANQREADSDSQRMLHANPETHCANATERPANTHKGNPWGAKEKDRDKVNNRQTIEDRMRTFCVSCRRIFEQYGPFETSPLTNVMAQSCTPIERVHLSLYQGESSSL